MGVFIGEYDRDIYDGERKVTIERFHVHPRWNHYTKANNIAVLKTYEVMYPTTSPWFESSYIIGPVRLSRESLPDHTDLKVVGWDIPGLWIGFGQCENTLPRELWAMNISNDECKRRLRPTSMGLSDDHLCAVPKNGALCNGDSGNPLVWQNPEGRHELVGIVSLYNRPCVKSDLPAVFTRISNHLDWIHEMMDLED
jgi:hypothetical protein